MVPGFCTVMIGFNADSVVVAGFRTAPDGRLTTAWVALAGVVANLTPWGRVMVVTPPEVAVRARDTIESPDPASGDRIVLVGVVGLVACVACILAAEAASANATMPLRAGWPVLVTPCKYLRFKDVSAK